MKSGTTTKINGAGSATDIAPTAAAAERERILVLSLLRRDATMIAAVLERAGLRASLCDDVAQMCTLARSSDIGALVIAEEALGGDGLARLRAALEAQPPWSDIPVLMLTGGGRTTRGSIAIARQLEPTGSMTLLERPVRILTMVSAAQAALRARRRQYQVRNLLESERASRSEAEAANQAKDRFLATLSHELRTPLTPVLLATTALVRGSDLPAELRDDIEMIRRNVELEAKLIDDLLDLTRVARGKIQLQPEAVDLHAVLEHAVRTCCGPETEAKRLKVNVRLDAKVHNVWGDKARLTQVFWNLIRNAIKFTPVGGEVNIRSFNAADDDRTIVASICDTGIGIEKDDLSRIFDAFEQGDDSITRRFGGLGLGLAISKALVELHGGTISAHSAGKNCGAEFTVHLATAQPLNPLGQKSAGRGAQETFGGSSSRSPERPAGEASPHILLVEDHRETADVLSRLLRSMSYRVTVVGDVGSARQRLSENNIDLLISDMGLPDGSGLDLMESVKSRPHKIKAIALTGFGMEEDIRRSREAGFAEHLVKPVDFDKLRVTVDRIARSTT